MIRFIGKHLQGCGLALGLLAAGGCATTKLGLTGTAPKRLEPDPAVLHTATEYALTEEEKTAAGDPGPEEIDSGQQLQRRLKILKAERLTEEGKVGYNKKRYKDAIDKFSAAEALLRQVSMNKAEVLKKLAQVQKYLGYAYHLYGRQLLDEATKEIELQNFDKARKLIDRGVQYDSALKPRAGRLRLRLAQRREQLDLELRTSPEYILRKQGA